MAGKKHPSRTRDFRAATYDPAMHWVLFFDGDCGFCSATVRIVARIDRRARINFSPLQGKLAASHELAGFISENGGTLVLLRETDGRLFFRSDAVIELARALGGMWRVFTVAKLIPRPLRDWAYRQIAIRRHWWPGTSASCALPDPELVRRLRE